MRNHEAQIQDSSLSIGSQSENMSNAAQDGSQVSEIRLKDGGRFEGSIINGVKMGKGIYYYPNGDTYLGDWENNAFHGQGIYIFASGERYEGSLRKGKKDGYGESFAINGNVYRGNHINDMKEGTGTYIYFSTG